MKKSFDLILKRDLLKLGCLTLAVTGTIAIFSQIPALYAPTILSFMVTTSLSPWVKSLERRGYPRSLAITLIFLCIFSLLVIFGLWGFQASIVEWNSLEQKVPERFRDLIVKATAFEAHWQKRYPFLNTIHMTSAVLNWGQETGLWFVQHGPELMGQALTWIFILPPLSFVLLNEGPAIQKRIFQLVPNRYFESFFLITHKIRESLSDYVRAKLLEAALVGLMVSLGLTLIQAPYVTVLGIVAGITNIVPYVGPILGFIPGLFAITLDPHSSSLIFSVVMVYVIANIVDTVLIFPLVVAKLINLHPLLLIAVVAAGQRYYGLIGMLISVPITAAIKVVIQEVYLMVYDHPASSENS